MHGLLWRKPSTHRKVQSKHVGVRSANSSDVRDHLRRREDSVVVRSAFPLSIKDDVGLWNFKLDSRRDFSVVGTSLAGEILRGKVSAV